MASPSGQWSLTLDVNVVGTTTFVTRPNSLGGWGLSDCILRTGSLRIGELTARRVVARADAAALTEYGRNVVLADPAGVVRFRGKRVKMAGNVSGQNEDQMYRFVDVWWDLMRRKYEQTWRTTLIVGNPSPPPAKLGTTVTTYNPHLILNAGRTIAQELTEVISYAASQGVAIAVGTITAPVYAPTDEVICRDCASIIEQLMSFVPGNVCFIDYAPATPTFNCVPESALTAVQLAAFGPNGSDDLTIESLDEDVATCVAIRWERIDRVTIDGETRERPGFSQDVYPVTCTGREEGAVSELVTLAGGSRNTITAPLTVGEFPGDNLDADFETAGALADFWQEKIFNLDIFDERIDPASLTITPGSFVRVAARSADEADPDALVTLPRYLIAGQIADWMRDDNDAQILWQKQRFTIKVNYNLYPSNSYTVTPLEKVKDRVINLYVTATNAPAGFNTYSRDTSIEVAEEPITGLAQFLYERLSVLRYKGQRRHIRVECDNAIRMGQKLNLTGGAAAWTTMGAIVQSVTENIDKGETTVDFGPVPRESVGLRVALARVHRVRRRWTATEQQTTGEL